MKILFMGTGKFALPTLASLVQQPWEIVAVVTQPDRPSGRGQKFTPPPVKVVAQQYRLPILQPEKIRQRSVVRQLEDLAPDVIVVAAFGQLLPKSILDLPPCGCLNIHPSLLPKYRGAAPIQWAIINGEQETGVTIMLLDEGEDTGDIVLQQSVAIQPDEKAPVLHDRLAKIASELLVGAIQKSSQNPPLMQKPPHRPQNNSEATYAPRLSKEIGQIDWSRSAEQIYNLVRGTFGWPSATTTLAGTTVKILDCSVVDKSSTQRGYPRIQPVSGLIGNPPLRKTLPRSHQNGAQVEGRLRGRATASESQLPIGQIKVIPAPNKTDGPGLIVGTSEGEVQLNQVQPATKRPMFVADFVNGYRIQTGDKADTGSNTSVSTDVCEN